MIDTINKAKAHRNIDQPLIIHSDRDSQYIAKEYKKRLKICSVVTQRKHSRGIMCVLNRFILLSNVNGSIDLKSAITNRHIVCYSNTWKLSTIQNEFIAIVTICRQPNSNECMKEHTLMLSFWQVKMGKNSHFNLY